MWGRSEVEGGRGGRGVEEGRVRVE
jgi:hypothetical protein